MKFILGVVLTCAVLLISLGVITLLWDKIWKQRNRDRYVAPNLAQREGFYMDAKIDYENFASGVYDCVMALSRDYNLEEVERPSQIYCPEVAERVDMRNGMRVFRYRLYRKSSTAIVSGKLKSQRNPDQAKALGRALERNLHVYCAPYTFTGPIITWDRDTYVLAEIPGVVYTSPNYTEIVI